MLQKIFKVCIEHVRAHVKSQPVPQTFPKHICVYLRKKPHINQLVNQYINKKQYKVLFRDLHIPDTTADDFFIIETLKSII